MPRKIRFDEVLSILKSGTFEPLMGCLEDEHLECKRAPYRFVDDAEKMEFAKDISALANANGGIILVMVPSFVSSRERTDICAGEAAESAAPIYKSTMSR